MGKSSLLNAILGRPRVIVSDVPGTTRDAVDTPFVRGDTRFRLVDTAGMRRKRNHRQGIEYYSELRALQALERSDIALVLVDSSDGLVEGDLSVADEARKAGCATLVVLSKWDITTVEIDDVRERMGGKLRQRPIDHHHLGADRPQRRQAAGRDRGAVRAASHLAGRHGRAQPHDRGDHRHARTSAQRTAPAQPAVRHPVHTRPPRFRIVVNDRGLVTRDYAYFVENQLRKRLQLEGCPVIIDFQSRQ